MATNTIKLTTLLMTLALVAVIELTAPWLVKATGWPVLAVLGIVRSVEIVAMLGAIIHFEKGLAAIGWSPPMWGRGLKIGVLWSLGFGLVAAIAMAALYLSGHNPLRMLRTPLPDAPGGVLLFFLVGGCIGPLAEEICFRGLVYTFFRRWGVIVALVASTGIFVALHALHGFPLIQVAGGLVFAVAYETSRNLMVPMVIHVLGNSAIFALSLPGTGN